MQDGYEMNCCGTAVDVESKLLWFLLRLMCMWGTSTSEIEWQLFVFLPDG